MKYKTIAVPRSKQTLKAEPTVYQYKPWIACTPATLIYVLDIKYTIKTIMLIDRLMRKHHETPILTCFEPKWLAEKHQKTEKIYGRIKIGERSYKYRFACRNALKVFIKDTNLTEDKKFRIGFILSNDNKRGHMFGASRTDGIWGLSDLFLNKRTNEYKPIEQQFNDEIDFWCAVDDLCQEKNDLREGKDYTHVKVWSLKTCKIPSEIIFQPT